MLFAEQDGQKECFEETLSDKEPLVHPLFESCKERLIDNLPSSDKPCALPSVPSLPIRRSAGSLAGLVCVSVHEYAEPWSSLVAGLQGHIMLLGALA